jgi:adenylate cyclase
MKYITSIWTTITLCILLLGIRVLDPSLVEQTRLNSFDQYIQSLPDKESDVVLLSLGEETLAVYGQYPFPRQTYAQLISDLRNANAGMIAFTLMFPEADRFGGDEVFISWVKDNGIILAQDASSRGRSDTAPYVGTATLGAGDAYDFVPKYKGLVTNIKELEEVAWGVGLINAGIEVDNITRRIPLLSQINGQLYPAMPLEIIRVIQDKPSYSLKADLDGIKDVMIPPYDPIKTDYNSSIWLNTNYTHVEYEYGKDVLPNLQGRTVVVGLSASGLGVQIPTPQGLFYAHELQASALQTVMDGASISRPQWADLLELFLLLIGSLGICGAIYWLSVLRGAALSALIVSGYGLYVWYVWISMGVLLDLTYPIIVYILSFSSASFNNFYIQFKLRQQIKGQFSTYLSPDMVNMLVKDPSLMKLGGDRKEMTFLFMDIVGFTPISEHYKNNDDPEGLVELVNEFLDAMTTIILKNGGTIDKYMGDCIMAFWNAPLPCKNHAEMAVKSAIEIEEKTNELKALYKERGLPDINVGTGVNTGDCIVGNMGSKSRFDYSVIGDAVNLAARLEATAARHEYIEYKTIISSFTQQLLPEGYVSHNIGTIRVKGKEEEITIYSPKKS